MGEDSRSRDLLGIKPVADSIKIVTQGMIDGASAFLGRICLPAAQEFGLLLRDRVSNWRELNKVKILQKAEEKLNIQSSTEGKHAHPRLIAAILNDGSWEAKEEVQDMWAGLLASACTSNGDDESNLIFISILAQLTSLQAHVVNYACENATKILSAAGWITTASEVRVSLEQLQALTSCADFHRLDRELDQLRNLGLIGYGAIGGGFSSDSTDADITPTSLALQMYVRCKGSNGDPSTYFGLCRMEQTQEIEK